MNDIFIVGAGGFGREIAWTIERINAITPVWNLLGFADDDPSLQSGTIAGYPLLGTVAKAAVRYHLAAAFIAIGNNAIREKVSRELVGRYYPVIIDPTAEVAPSAEISTGSFVGPRAVVSVGARIGRFVIVNARAGVGHDSEVADFVQICPGATLSGNTIVGKHALIGSNACTVPGIVIGANVKIAAGLPVYHHLADGVTLSPFGVFKR